MNSIVNVVVYSDDDNYNKYDDILRNENIKIVGIGKDFSKIKAYLVLHKKAVVVVEDTALTEDVDVEKVISYIIDRDCGVIFCIKKFIQASTMQKHPNCEVVYRQRYAKYEEYLRGICDKAKEISKNLNEQQDVPKYTSSLKSEVAHEKKESIFDRIRNEAKKEEIKEEINLVEEEASVENKNPYSSYMKNRGFKKIIAIGTSTGGPETLAKVLRAMPSHLDVPIVIVQHMPENFTKMYADRISKECNILVTEPKNGDPVLGGVAYIAPGGLQMELNKIGGEYFIKVLPADSNYVNNPSVDVLFNSVANNFSGEIIAVMLTGMGRDGSKAMLKIKNKGGYTIGQDEKSSIVYGMPKAAYDIGAIKVQLSIDDIAGKILSQIY